MTEKEWIAKIAPDAVYCMLTYGYPASALIGQACLETGYGSTKLVEYNNVIGMKTTLLPYDSLTWKGNSVVKGTWEEVNGKKINKDDSFRVYGSIRDCLLDYCQFMKEAKTGTAYKYRDILAYNNPEQVLRSITGRYATDSAYASKVISIMQKHGLTAYDAFPAISEPGIIKNPSFGLHNTYARSATLKYLVMHYVGATGGAAANVAYYNRTSVTGSSADYYVDFDGKPYEYNANVSGRACKAVGGGKQSGYGGTLNGIASNQNCINIEMCVRNKGDKSAGSKDWYFEDATVEGAAKLAAYLMCKYKIPLDRLIRHFDVNGKFCPGVTGWIAPMGGEAKWNSFKERVGALMGAEATKTHAIIKKGSKGPDVKEFQQGLLDLGVCDCRDYVDRVFADGDFGSRTDTYVRRFQTVYSLDVDGICGPKTWAKMDAMLAETNFSEITFTASELLAAARAKTDAYREGGFAYGNPSLAPWYVRGEKVTACERSIIDYLHDCGLCAGNREVKSFYQFLLSIGGQKVNEAKAGDIVFANDFNHVFLCAGENLRYDCGKNDRIKLTGDYSGYKHQPFNEGISNASAIVRLPFKTEPAEVKENTTATQNGAVSGTEATTTASTGKVQYQVQAGLFNNKANAEKKVSQLNAAGFSALINEIEG